MTVKTQQIGYYQAVLIRDKIQVFLDTWSEDKLKKFVPGQMGRRYNEILQRDLTRLNESIEVSNQLYLNLDISVIEFKSLLIIARWKFLLIFLKTNSILFLNIV